MTTAVRQQLADAASSVDGVTAHPYFKQGNSPGHTHIRLERIDYPNKLGGVRRWNVVMVLSQDLAAAEKFLEAHLPQLREALEPHLVITDVVLQQIDTGAGIVPSVFINGSREE